MFFSIGIALGCGLLKWGSLSGVPGIFFGVFPVVFVLGGAMQIIRPMIFAAFSAEGITFASFRVPLLRWEEILAVHSGPLEVETDSLGRPRPNPGAHSELLVMFRPPIVLRIRAGNAAMAARLALLYSDVVRLDDGSYELMIDTSQCPVPTAEVVRRIRACLPSARETLPGTSPQAFVEPEEFDSPSRRFAPAVLLVAGGVLFLGIGAGSIGENSGPAAWIAVGLGSVVTVWGLAALHARVRGR